jgi:hypothetical protein
MFPIEILIKILECIIEDVYPHESNHITNDSILARIDVITNNGMIMTH